MTLDAMKIGQEGTIAVVGGAGALRRDDAQKIQVTGVK